MLNVTFFLIIYRGRLFIGGRGRKYTFDTSLKHITYQLVELLNTWAVIEKSHVYIGFSDPLLMLE